MNVKIKHNVFCLVRKWRQQQHETTAAAAAREQIQICFFKIYHKTGIHTFGVSAPQTPATHTHKQLHSFFS